ncbi:unnamed protein product [Parascedosporium putredinis]|uniref:Uncharacterized protein n=1 Tax=Parascedosporium putredinis TaxID=1442378 RepID=A0A9P1GVB1_9PEZI|nr:unnamed protein product [Parascedosporium putredinis]CAI7987689.1 unnamed protein product [Parascedosporium putredinis]
MATPAQASGGLTSPTFAQTTAEFRLSSDVSGDEAPRGPADYRDHPAQPPQDRRGRSTKGKRKARDLGANLRNSEEDWSPPTTSGTAKTAATTKTTSTTTMTMGIQLHPRSTSVSTTASFRLYSQDEEDEVVRKFDRKLVLFVALLYMLSFIDRYRKR